MELTNTVTEDEVIKAIPNALVNTYFYRIGEKYRGKVRDNYTKDGVRIVVTTDRLSAFDRIITAIPFKGQILNQQTAFWFEKTKDVVPNHVISVPDPNVMVIEECDTFPVEMVVRGFITGSAWRDYNEKGAREKSGVRLRDKLRKNEKFDEPIITPTTKAAAGHDEDISREEIIRRGLVKKEEYDEIAEDSLKLFRKGQEMCAANGIILVDTKYEFGRNKAGQIVVIDEIHTPDSSRFWWGKTYQEMFDAGKDQQALDKEFERANLKKKGFDGNGPVPKVPDNDKAELVRRYATSFEWITGEKFKPESYAEPIYVRIAENLKKAGYDASPYAVVPILMGSESDREHAKKIGGGIRQYNIDVSYHVASAHKNPELLVKRVDELSEMPGVYCIVGVAGWSNALGAVAGARNWLPVITTTPTPMDSPRYADDVMSSTPRYPKFAPAAFCGEETNVGLNAVKIVAAGVPALRKDVKFVLDFANGRL